MEKKKHGRNSKNNNHRWGVDNWSNMCLSHEKIRAQQQDISCVGIVCFVNIYGIHNL